MPAITVVADGQPYPFFLAHSLTLPVERIAEELGRPPIGWSNGSTTASARNWFSRAGQAWLWSRGEELVTERFPEIVEGARALPDGTVLDGEILVWRDDRPTAVRPAAEARDSQERQAKLLREAPACSWPTTCSKPAAKTCALKPQRERRAALERLAAQTRRAAFRRALLPTHGNNSP